MPALDSPAKTFLRLMTLQRVGDAFVSEAGGAGGGGRMYGATLCAQALMAGAAQTEHPLPHSLHLLFLLPGDATEPVTYSVTSLRSGRAFSTFQVVGVQPAGTIVQGTVSFTSSRPAVDHQFVGLRPVPDHTEALPIFEALGIGGTPSVELHSPGVIKFAVPMPQRSRGDDPTFTAWYDLPAELPPDPALGAAALLYGSDCMAGSFAKYLFGVPGGQSSLEHCAWFHGDRVVKGSLVFQYESPRASLGRALLTGNMFHADGELAMSVAQEAVYRTPDAAR